MRPLLPPNSSRQKPSPGAKPGQEADMAKLVCEVLTLEVPSELGFLTVTVLPWIVLFFVW